MTATVHELHPQVRRILAIDSAEVQHAIARLDLLRELRTRRAHLARLELRHRAELADAEIRLGIAKAALDELDRSSSVQS